ncbi:MAG: hypothetical protein JXR83_04395 [Deltaproteobacteria bacterium]|nr:hypothetical protein [Deltaproteobacteria bacterium]
MSTRHLPAIAILASAIGTGAADSVPPLPDRFFVNTPTRSVTRHYLYAIHDGRIWTKANPEGPYAGRDDWHLFMGTGLPFASEDKPVQPARAIVELSADDQWLVALSDQGYLYRTDEHGWTHEWGLPQLGLTSLLRLPAGTRGWAFSNRHRNVEYYEDPYGNQFNWGRSGCTTLLALKADGQQIAYSDPWVSPDFSRQICGPRRGRVRIESLAGSASTLFALTAAGDLYTRFYDYDSDGSTPMFRFRYFERVERHGVPGSDPRSELRTRGLPPPDWVEQPAIAVGPRGRLGRNIAIVQNGKGNAARELRVQGLGPDGRPGYYFKQLEDPIWRFRVTGEAIAETDLLPRRPPPVVTVNRDRAAAGFVVDGHGNRRHGIRVEAPDLNLNCSPLRLRFCFGPGREFEALLHTADAWTVFALSDPEDDPDAYRMLKGTLQLPAEVMAAAPETLDPLIARWLRPTHLDPFAWALVANQREAHLLRAGAGVMLGRDATRIVLRTAASERGRSRIALRPYTAAAARLLADLRPDAPAAERRARLRATREALRRQRADSERHGLAFALLERALQPTLWLIATGDAIGAEKLDPQWPWYLILAEHWPALMTANALATMLFLDQSAADYDAALAQIARLVEEPPGLQRRRDRLEDSHGSQDRAQAPVP